ncbi:hypothetical protein [Arthrobacter bambusae]|uniref:hypothetical protein n=1 Tax=Arthrobacter bambusae TaxID=1338426 RepID=UPI00277EAB83|nr:hypothetical protein [Arthrobacter bambusae]MDQ0032248.1 hypothetical protein [Arthrobacter bambusae]MDQ0100363.1 hypothetical protein [Arthrobacter bambusae]
MTLELQPEVDRLTEVSQTLFGDESRWITANGYPNSLALCIIDSIWSTGSAYQSVQNVVSNYRAYRAAEGGDASTDGTKELLKTFADVRGGRGFADRMKNHKRAHTRKGALLKAEVVLEAADALKGIGICTMADVRAEYAQDKDLTRIEKTWLGLTSQRSGVTFNYFVGLAGYQSVKPDRMIYRFIEKHTGLTKRQLGTRKATELIRRVADAYSTEARKLDHTIWRFESGREIFFPDAAE